MKSNRKRGHAWEWTLRILAVLLLVTACAIPIGGLYIRTHFETALPADFFKLRVKGESPQFFVYRFEDRLNRVGVPENVTAEAFSQKKTSYIHYPDIPKDLLHAFIAIEDKRFFEHNGVDWRRTASATLHYVLGSSKQFGGSTITQQLIKNLTGEDGRSIRRKIQEMFYALDIERMLDKTEILEMYLNVIHFSDQCNGISEAAWHYFSKTPGELTVAEAASIAAITNSPSYYNPIRNPEHNLARRNLILSEMYAQGYLSEEAYQSAISEDLHLNVAGTDPKGERVNSWYVDMVIEDVIGDLMQKYGLNRNAASQFLYTGGFRIEMAMDPEIQELVEEYYRTAIKVPQNKDGKSAQSSLIVLDAKTGDVLGVAGAVGDKKANRIQNFATQTLRPPGSAMKPLTVYAPALEQGIIDWASVYDDVPVRFTGHSTWPKNATGVYRGLTNIPYAIAQSTNTVAVRVLEDLGLETAFQFGKNVFHLNGMVSDPEANDCDYAALALGQLNYGVTLRDLTAAYTAFADAGVYHPWKSYYRVLDSEGRILLSKADVGEIALREENAAIMTKLMQGVIRDGTSSSITLDQRMECAGKSGTTTKDFDRWFVGYTPELICGVWCGYEYPEPLEGKNICTQIWDQVMNEIVEVKGGKTRFEVPSTVVRATYCKDSGRLIGDACQKDPRGNRAEVGWFIQGKEPHAFCDCHQICRYDLENGGVSHGFCPEEQTKEIGLICVKRSFPFQLYISDAQYVYGGDPRDLLPNENPTMAYFAKARDGYWGISYATKQYNRSCYEHSPTTDNESVPPQIPNDLPFWDE